MRAFKIASALLVVMVVAVACTPAGEETATTEADVQAIHRVRQAHDAAVNAGDLDAWLAVFADDAVSMPPNAPPVVGKEAIRSLGQGVFEHFNFEETMSSAEVVAAGDWGFDRGTYTLTPTPAAGGQPAEGAQLEIMRELNYAQEGKYLWILRRQPDGSWKIACDMWSSNNPPPEM